VDGLDHADAAHLKQPIRPDNTAETEFVTDDKARWHKMAKLAGITAE
jgi:protein tyrosine/serine phosphatase